MAISRDKILIKAFKVGSVINFDETNLVQNSVIIDKYCMQGETLSYGTAISSELQFTYYEDEKINWEEIDYVDYYSNDILLFRGLVEETRKVDDTRQVICLDPLTTLDEEYNTMLDNIVFETGEVSADVAIERILSYKFNELPTPVWNISHNYNSRFIPTITRFQDEVFETCTIREVLGWFLEITGLIVTLKGDTIIIKSPTYKDIVFDSTTIYDPLVVSEHTMDLSGVTMIKEVEKDGEIVDEEIISGSSLRSFDIVNNPFSLKYAEQSWTDVIYERDETLVWTPVSMSVEWESGAELELLDVITIKDRENVEYKTLITSIQYTHGERVQIESIGANWKKEKLTIGSKSVRQQKAKENVLKKNIDLTFAKMEAQHQDFVDNYQTERQELIDEFSTLSIDLESTKSELDSKMAEAEERANANLETINSRVDSTRIGLERYIDTTIYQAYDIMTAEMAKLANADQNIINEFNAKLESLELNTNLYIAYANKVDDSTSEWIDFSTGDSTGREYVGILTSSEEVQPTDPSLYEWIKVTDQEQIRNINKLINEVNEHTRQIGLIESDNGKINQTLTTVSQTQTEIKNKVEQVEVDITSGATYQAINEVKQTATETKESMVQIKSDLDGKVSSEEYNTTLTTINGRLTDIGKKADGAVQTATFEETIDGMAGRVAKTEQGVTQFNTFKSTYEGDIRSIASIKSDVSTLNTFKSTAESQISTIATLESRLDNVGKKNLMSYGRGDVLTEWSAWSTGTMTNTGSSIKIETDGEIQTAIRTPIFVTEWGKKYTISFDFKCGTNSFDFNYIYVINSTYGNKSLPRFTQATKANDWVRVAIEFEAPYTATDNRFLIGRAKTGSANWFEVRYVTITEDAGMAQWSKSDSEIESMAENTVIRTVDGTISRISDKANGLSSFVQQTEASFKSMITSDEVSTLISQNADNILLSVDEKIDDSKLDGNEIKSLINLTTDGVTIHGKQVSITGDTYIANSAIKNANIESLNGGKIVANSISGSKITVDTALVNKLVGSTALIDDIWSKFISANKITSDLIVSKLAKIGGFTISENSLSAGSGDSYVRLSSNYLNAIQIGGETYDTAKFSVSHQGDMTAKSGKIGKWDIVEDGLMSTGSNYYIKIAPTGTYPIFFGTDANNSKFRVDYDGNIRAVDAEFVNGDFSGKVTAKDGSIGGFTITNNTLTSGSGSSYIRISGATGYTPILVGGETWDSSRFAVSSTGTLKAEGANISGTINAKEGSIGYWNIDSNGIYRSGNGYYIHIKPTNTYPIFFGTDSNNSKFRVSQTGTVLARAFTLEGGTVGGTNVYSSYMSGGSWSSATGSGSFSGSASFNSGSYTGTGKFNNGMTVGGSAIEANGTGIKSSSLSAANIYFTTLRTIGVDTQGRSYSAQLGNGGWSITNSDIRLKENIEELDYSYNEEIYKMPLIKYNYKGDKNKNPQVGVNANYLMKILPEDMAKSFLHQDKITGYYGANYEYLTPYLVKVVQEQNERIKKLEERLNG